MENGHGWGLGGWGDKDMYAQNPENFDKIQISWKI